MDKDNLAVSQLIKVLTHEGLEITSREAQEQALSATLLMLVGLILTCAGFITIVLKLRCMASCSILIMLRRFEKYWSRKNRQPDAVKVGSY